MSDVTWDPSANRYRDRRTGQFVGEDAVRAATQKVASALADRLAGFTQELLEGRRDLPSWQRDFADALVDHHLANAVVGAGGLKTFLAATPGSAAQSRLVDQLKFLRGFARDLESGRQPFDGRAVNRARLYGEAANVAFEEQRRANYHGQVAMEERWVLSNAEHCSGCSAQAMRGWVPAGSLPPIGSRQCRTRCKCRIITRRDPTSLNPCQQNRGREFKAARR